MRASRLLRHLSSGAAPVCRLHDHTVVVGSPPRTLIDNLSITIREREQWALIGNNGTGKTVTLQLLASMCGESAAHVSFDSHRKILRDEMRAFKESRFDTIHKRATPASFLFPHLYPDDPEHPDGYKGYRPPRTRVSPLPVRYDAGGDDPLLASLEHAACTGEAGRVLEAFGLLEARHRPLCVLSTGQLRKVLLASCLLAPPRLLLLDEALDGLDARSCGVTMELVERTSNENSCAVVMVAHRSVDLPLTPTDALIIGLGENGRGWRSDAWAKMRPSVDAFFAARCEEPAKPLHSALSVPARLAQGDAQLLETKARRAEPVVEFTDVTIRYPNDSVVFQPPLRWTVREGDNWAVVGGNGSGKTTLVDLISGENVLGYTQDIRLFGRPKGSGESVWSIKAQLGIISTATHMAYVDYADPVVEQLSRPNGFARTSGTVSTWEVVCSGFFDSVGLYQQPTQAQADEASRWVRRFGLEDLVVPPQPNNGVRGLSMRAAQYSPKYAVAAARAAAAIGSSRTNASGARRNFFHLSFGQQKLVLLCRAAVKRPRLLLLDEPTHGLSSTNRSRLLSMLAVLAADPGIAIVHVTHRQDEIEELGFENVLQLQRR